MTHNNILKINITFVKQIDTNIKINQNALSYSLYN